MINDEDENNELKVDSNGNLPKSRSNCNCHYRTFTTLNDPQKYSTNLSNSHQAVVLVHEIKMRNVPPHNLHPRARSAGRVVVAERTNTILEGGMPSVVSFPSCNSVHTACILKVGDDGL
jgi:hypothetical protein